MRAPASRASPRAMVSSTRPAPAAIVSAACASALSPSAIAAAMPPCAHAVEAPWPSGAAEITVTGRGASFKAQNNPARPPPTMTISPALRMTIMILVWHVRLHSSCLGSAVDGGQFFRLIIRCTDRRRFLGDRGIDGDLLAQAEQAVQNLGQRDPLHVRAQIARSHHLDIGQFGLNIVGHRAFGDHHHAFGMVVADPVDHVRGRAGEIGFCQHVGRAFRMRDDLHRRIGFAIGAQLIAGETLMHFAGALPGNDLHAGFRRDVSRQILVRQKNHGRRVQALDHLQRVRRGAADVDFRLHLGRCVDIGDDGHAGKTFAQQPHVGAGYARGERTAGARIRNQHGPLGVQDLRGLRHEVHAALHDDVGLHLGGFDRELQRVAADIGDAMEDLRRLVIMRQDDRVALCFSSLIALM